MPIYLSIFLFSKIKLRLKGRWFDTTEEIQADLQRGLDTLTEKEVTVGPVPTCRREIL
jgi:hypothetical protein